MVFLDMTLRVQVKNLYPQEIKLMRIGYYA